jgi:hypothetical protein
MHQYLFNLKNMNGKTVLHMHWWLAISCLMVVVVIDG